MEQLSLFALDLQLLLYKNLNDKNIKACWLLDARQIFTLTMMIEIYNNTTKIRIQLNNCDKNSGNIVVDVKCTSNDAIAKNSWTYNNRNSNNR